MRELIHIRLPWMRSKEDIIYYEFTVDKGFGELGACISIREERPGHYELEFTNGFISYVDGAIARGVQKK